MREWVECELAQILLMTENFSSPQVIVLREKGGSRSFLVHIGLFEALAISRRVHGEATPRPMTHDILVAVIRAMGGVLSRICISDLREDGEGNGTFFGLLIVNQNGEEREIDCRPSDAVAMAVRADCPIFVAREVFDRVSTG